MIPTPTRTRLTALLAAAIALAVQAPLWAQPLPDNIARAPQGSDWIHYVVSIVLVIVVGIPSFMSAKRSHQD